MRLIISLGMSKIFSKSLRVFFTLLLHLAIIVGMALMPFSFAPLSAQTTDTEEVTIEPYTIVDTGAAAAVSESYDVENINDIETAAEETDQATTSEEMSDIPEEIPDLDTDLDTDELSTTTPTSTDSIIEISNQITASTSATTTAESGNNTASGTGVSAISTGDAYAYSNVVNLTNTNLIDSTGFIVFLNQLFGMNGVDLRDLFDVFSGSTTTNPCSDLGCEPRQLEYYLQNQADVNNNITVTANTGDNQATGTDGVIVTGDAYAAANVVNIANTNIIDSNYMVLTFSNFGDLLGDIVLPGKHLLEKLFQTIGNSSPTPMMTSESQANIQNTVTTDASTGNNTATGATSTILTGDAVTYSNIYNQVNTNVVNNDSFTMLFRVAGDWDGEIYGLPEGLTWERTGGGIAITSIGDMYTTAVSTPSVSVDILNSANISNTVSVSASTGGNHATSTDNGYIETGNAYAAANVTNIANTNIIGRNWSLLIFDIFGDWSGNISFGQPDLWIGGTASTNGGAIGSNQEVTYTFTISNLGDARVSNVLLRGNLNSELISLSEPIEDINIGSLSPGETVEKTFTAKVTDALPSGSFPVDLTVELSGDEPEKNLENNTEVVTVIAENRRSGGGGGSSRGGSSAKDIRPAADLVVTKTANTHNIAAGETVYYEVSVTNNGGPVYGAILYDTLFGPSGEVVANKHWELETIDPEETITITYETAYATNTPSGTYLNRAQVLGYHKNRLPKYMVPYDSRVATVPLSINIETPLVLGMATSTISCEPHLTSYLRYGVDNDKEQVYRLQTFFNNFTTYQVPLNSVFDATTEQAVRDFQEEYASEILEPWNLESPSGYVYYTTKKKINELYCNETRTFPLTASELFEISRFKFTQITRIFDTTSQKNPTLPIAQENNTGLILVSSTTKKSDFNNTPEPYSEIAEVATPEANQEDKGFFARVVGWVKNARFSDLKFWNVLFASEN